MFTMFVVFFGIEGTIDRMHSSKPDLCSLFNEFNFATHQHKKTHKEKQFRTVNEEYL